MTSWVGFSETCQLICFYWVEESCFLQVMFALGDYQEMIKLLPFCEFSLNNFMFIDFVIGFIYDDLDLIKNYKHYLWWLRFDKKSLKSCLLIKVNFDDLFLIAAWFGDNFCYRFPCKSFFLKKCFEISQVSSNPKVIRLVGQYALSSLFHVAQYKSNYFLVVLFSICKLTSKDDINPFSQSNGLPVSVNVLNCTFYVVKDERRFGQLLNNVLVVILQDELFGFEFMCSHRQQSMPATNLSHWLSINHPSQLFKLKHFLNHLNFTFPQLKTTFIHSWNDIVCVLLI